MTLSRGGYRKSQGVHAPAPRPCALYLCSHQRKQIQHDRRTENS
nr:MAG TPA: hypothetical protein [Caudoviricetes sp.]DAM35593.1 MAG TPA: hypothetical protein [Bacteriophage sp.]